MLSLFVGCDSTFSDPLLPTRAVFRLAELNDEGGLVVNVQGDRDLRTPTNVESDTLVLIRGRRYAGRIEFFNAEGENITFALAQNADLVEITYEASGVPPFRFVRTDTETNYDADLDGIDLLVGLQFEIEIPDNAPSLARGELAVQVLEYAPREKAIQGEPVLWSNFTLPLIVSRPGPRFPTPLDRITGLRLNFSAPGIDPVSSGYSNPSGLENGLAFTPEEPFNIPRIDGVRSPVYNGTLELDGILAGSGQERSLTRLIREEGVWYEVRYRVEGTSFFRGGIRVQDQDLEGRPIGLSFEFEVDSVFPREFVLRIQVLRHKDDVGKTGRGEGAPRTVVDVALPLLANP